MNIKQVPAHPNNYSKNHGANQLKKIVMHWIVGELSAADATFQNPKRRASAHYGVGSNGEIHQYVADKNIAWHAGPKVNYESIGIEHAGGQLINGKRKHPTQKCHDTSAELVAMLSKKYGTPLDRNHIRKHSEYMNTQCPGSLDVDYIINKAKQINKPQKLDYALYKKGAHVYAHFKSGIHNGEYKIIDKVTSKTTDAGRIFMSQGTHDRIVSPNCTKRFYRMIFGGVAKEIDLREVAPPVDPCKDIKKELKGTQTELKDIKGVLSISRIKNTELRAKNSKLAVGLKECQGKLKKAQEETVDNFLVKLKNWLMGLLGK